MSNFVVTKLQRYDRKVRKPYRLPLGYNIIIFRLELKEHWSEESEIPIDTTEQRRQNPGNQQDQKEDYSKKKAHTLKFLLLTNGKRKIKYLSEA